MQFVLSVDYVRHTFQRLMISVAGLHFQVVPDGQDDAHQIAVNQVGIIFVADLLHVGLADPHIA